MENEKLPEQDCVEKETTEPESKPEPKHEPEPESQPEPNPEEKKEVHLRDSATPEFESDFEDNITVTVPPTARVENERPPLNDRPYSTKNLRSPRPPGIDSSPKYNLMVD